MTATSMAPVEFVAFLILLLVLASRAESFSPGLPVTRAAQGRISIQRELYYKSNVRSEQLGVDRESQFSAERLLSTPDNASGNNDDEALGPTSCNLGPCPVEILDGQHLCNRDSFVSATIYAPRETSTDEKWPLPSVVLIGGWGCGESVLAAWGPFLASHGIVAMTIGAPRPFEDTPWERCRSLLDASRALQTEHDRKGSTLRGRLDASRRSLIGLSLGGGGAQLAALEDPTLSCVVALVPHDGTGPPLSPPDAPSFPEQLSAEVPSLIICGEKDDIADPREHAWPMYHRSRSTKAILEVAGGDHGVAHGPAGWGTKEDTPIQGFLRMCTLMYTLICWYALGRSVPFEGNMEGHAREHSPNGAIGGMTLAWLRWFLLNDDNARSRLLDRPNIASGYATSGLELAAAKEEPPWL